MQKTTKRKVINFIILIISVISMLLAVLVINKIIISCMMFFIGNFIGNLSIQFLNDEINTNDLLE